MCCACLEFKQFISYSKNGLLKVIGIQKTQLLRSAAWSVFIFGSLSFVKLLRVDQDLERIGKIYLSIRASI